MEARRRGLESVSSEYGRFVEEFAVSFAHLRARYETLLLEARTFPEGMILESLEYVVQDIRGDDSYAVELRECGNLAGQHLRDVLRGLSPSMIPEWELRKNVAGFQFPTVGGGN
jgi:hypothetical protein